MSLPTVERRLWLHSSTDRALLVSPSFISHDTRAARWVPRSQVTVLRRNLVTRGPVRLGTLLTLQVPAWLCAERGLNADAELPGGTELEELVG